MSIDNHLKEAARKMRILALWYDAEAELVRERGFQYWQNECLMPQAVNRWIKEIGDEV